MSASPELLGLCVGSEQGAAHQIQIDCISFFTSFSKSMSAIIQAPEGLPQTLLAEHPVHKPTQGQQAGVRVVAGVRVGVKAAVLPLRELICLNCIILTKGLGTWCLCGSCKDSPSSQIKIIQMLSFRSFCDSFSVPGIPQMARKVLQWHVTHLEVSWLDPLIRIMIV